MAVVTKYGTGSRDPAAVKNIENVYAAGTPRTINSLVTVANGDSINSVLYIGRVPSNAIIDPYSRYDFSAITGLTDLDIGFLNDPDALVDGDDVSSAGTQTLRGHGTLTLVNQNKRAWELAGLAADPGGELDIIATLKAAAGAAGTLGFTIYYSKTA